MKNEIINIIIDNNGNLVSRRLSESYFKKNYLNLYLKIIKSFDSSLSFSAKLFMIYHGITKKPKCLICKNDVRFKKFSLGFSKYCSMKCIGMDKNVQERREKTTENLYGGKFTLTSPELLNKVNETNKLKYGTEHPQNLDIFKEKTIQTNIKKYGVEHHLKLKSQLNKQKRTNLDRYGVTNVNQSIKIKNKIKETSQKKYGTDCPLQNTKIRDKIKKTNIEKYGNDCLFQVEMIKDKGRKTNLKKYGFDSYSKTQEYKEQIKETKKKRYDNENYNNRKKSKITSLMRYGVDNPSKSKNVIDKIRHRVNFNYKEKYSKLLSINVNDIIINDDLLLIENYCKNHENFEISKSLLYSRVIDHGHENICTRCNPISENASILENELNDFVKSLNIKLVEKNTTILSNNQEIDIYMPDYKLGIEFNGLYWHSELFKDKNYHLNKTEECEKLGIQLLHIFEDEWIYKKNILKSIIRSKLNILQNKIFARKCEIKEITSKICSDFLNENHIQGNVNSLIKLGLFYNNELTSVMTFEKTRKGLGNTDRNKYSYNLNRFCSKLETQVIGGASKLLNYFIKTYSPISIITYADKRYSKGNLYKKLGFNMVHTNKPSYSYFNKNKKIRYHRFTYRKEAIIKLGWYVEDKSVNEIILDHNLCKIYDCGNIKFEMKFNKID